MTYDNSPEFNQDQPRSTQLAKTTAFPAMLDKFKSEIARALPRHLSPDRMCRIALTEFRKNPKLAECDPRSVFAAIIIASQLGVEPGVLGQAYLIPYKVRGETECQLIVGYQGLVDLVRRSGLVQRIEAHVVYEGDTFTYRTGLTTVLEHEPVLDGPKGKLRLVYAVAELKDGGYHVEVMTEDQVNTIRDRSQGYINAKKYNKETPWDTNTDEMWRKTAMRRICKYLPKSAEIALAFDLDDAAARGRQNITVQEAIDNTWQAPILEVSTQDQNLADKSAANLQAIRDRHSKTPEPATATVQDSTPAGTTIVVAEGQGGVTSGESVAPPLSEPPTAKAELMAEEDPSQGLVSYCAKHGHYPGEGNCPGCEQEWFNPQAEVEKQQANAKASRRGGSGRPHEE